jgi:hypothetical protein
MRARMSRWLLRFVSSRRLRQQIPRSFAVSPRCLSVAVAVGLTIAFMMVGRAYADNSSQTPATRAQDEDRILPLLSFDPPGIMHLAKTKGAKDVLVRGILVDAGGAPLVGKTVCPIVADGEGATGVVAALPGGQLKAVTAKSTANGLFELTIPRFVRLAVSPCEVKGITVKLLWKTPILKEFDATKASVDLGKVAPLK